MQLANVSNTMSSKELLVVINEFRVKEGSSALEHKTLMRTIRDEFEEEINESKIVPVDYKDAKGENRPMYVLTLSQAKQLLVRESKAVRKAVIQYIEQLEQQKQLPTTYLDALKELVASETERLALLEKNTVMQPKADYYDKVLQPSGLYTTTQVAKDLGMSAVALNRKLQELGIQFKVGGQWVLKAAHQDKQYTDTVSNVIEHSDGRFETHLITKWTEKGRKFIIETLDNL